MISWQSILLLLCYSCLPPSSSPIDHDSRKTDRNESPAGFCPAATFLPRRSRLTAARRLGGSELAGFMCAGRRHDGVWRDGLARAVG